MNITKDQYKIVKEKAFKHFMKNKRVTSPLFWEVKVTEEWFNHIERKTVKKKRSIQESYIRYLCFMHFDFIIQNSQLYQDYHQEYKKIEVKRKWKKVVENKLVTYYWLIAIVNNNKQRIKVVLKKVDWWSKYEYVSVIPVWKTTNNWPQLYLNSESDF